MLKTMFGLFALTQLCPADRHFPSRLGAGAGSMTTSMQDGRTRSQCPLDSRCQLFGVLDTLSVGAKGDSHLVISCRQQFAGHGPIGPVVVRL